MKSSNLVWIAHKITKELSIADKKFWKSPVRKATWGIIASDEAFTQEEIEVEFDILDSVEIPDEIL